MMLHLFVVSARTSYHTSSRLLAVVLTMNVEIGTLYTYTTCIFSPR